MVEIRLAAEFVGGVLGLIPLDEALAMVVSLAKNSGDYEDMDD